MKLITMPRLAVLAVAGASLSLAACNNKADDATEANPPTDHETPTAS